MRIIWKLYEEGDANGADYSYLSLIPLEAESIESLREEFWSKAFPLIEPYRNYQIAHNEWCNAVVKKAREKNEIPYYGDGTNPVCPVSTFKFKDREFHITDFIIGKYRNGYTKFEPEFVELDEWFEENKV